MAGARVCHRVSVGLRALGRPASRGRQVSLLESLALTSRTALCWHLSPLYVGMWCTVAFWHVVWTTLLVGHGSWYDLLHLQTACQAHVAGLHVGGTALRVPEHRGPFLSAQPWNLWHRAPVAVPAMPGHPSGLSGPDPEPR